MVVLTAAVGLSGQAWGQQTGLFPRAPIRRQRVPCDQEDPTYKIYKQQYFGYHPTCWRTFPTGWGCPSAEAPNRERSFQELKPGQSSEEEMRDLGIDEDRGAPQPRRAPGELELPPDRVSPFDMDQRPGARPNVNPLPRGNARPGTLPPRGEDPFGDVNQGAVVPPARGRAGAGGDAPAPAPGSPDLTAPAGSPPQGSASRSVGDESQEEAVTEGEGPLLGLTDSDLVRSDSGNAAPDYPSGAATAAASGSSTGPNGSAMAGSPQPRRRLFGNLFSGLGSNWLRR
jgi:hypothetical protein